MTTGYIVKYLRPVANPAVLEKIQRYAPTKKRAYEIARIMANATGVDVSVCHVTKRRGRYVRPTPQSRTWTDLHRCAAMLMFMRPYQGITPEMRADAKRRMFAACYGHGTVNLSEIGHRYSELRSTLTEPTKKMRAAGMTGSFAAAYGTVAAMSLTKEHIDKYEKQMDQIAMEMITGHTPCKPPIHTSTDA